MKKVISHFKPAILPIIFIIGLLVVQAYCDLALPEYMSNIVDVGIQQGGIESVVPSKISADEMKKIKLFMTEDNSDYINGFYSKDIYKKKDILVLKNDVTQQQNDKLSDILTTPMFITYMIEQYESGELDDSSFSGTMDMSQFGNISPNGTTTANPNMQASGANKSAMEDMDTFTAMSYLPEENRMEMVDNIESSMEGLKSMGDDTMLQALVPYIQDIEKSAGVDIDALRMNYLYKAGLLMLAYVGVILICTITVAYISSVTGSRISRDLRSSTYNRIISFSARETDKFSNASLITRSTNDIQQIQMVIIMTLKMIIYAPIIGIGAFMKVLNIASGMSWVIGIAVGVIIALIIVLLSVAMPKFAVLQKLVDKVNLVAREILTGIPVIRAFSREKFEEERFDESNTKLTFTNLFVNRIMAIMMPAMMLLMNGTSVLIMWVGAGQIDEGNIQVGVLMSFIQYTMQVIMAFLMISMLSVMLPRAIVSAKRINEVLDTEVSIKNPKEPKDFDERKKGYITFDNVTFTYPGAEEPVLSNISFVAEPGKTTAIIGATGSGKSTLVNLIPRFYDATNGVITVDGANVREVTLHNLRDKIGYVPQKGILFSGTIKSNIAFSDSNMSMDKIERAAKISQSKDFIEEKQKGYESHISQGGTNVSGGQRQRLSIARAIAKDPEIYIFDDSFSALDFKTDSALRKALREETGDSTIIVVAQRISTVINAEQIIVLDSGQMVGIGTHKELMNNCQVYRDIAESQLSKEELS